ncbi:helix-turn-helix domain-containing protein [Streptomyces sp. NPDC002454]|uniref:helix-turn-helix domain-containing protein n=1 Tax=Streptomyces sp. NPDC002490 TaxID=3154416 RepID=UPI0033275107
MSERRAAPTVGQVVLGKRLKDLREAKGLSREQAAGELRVTAATVRRMETAEVALKVPYVHILLPLYGASTEETDAFLSLVEDANRPGWWQRYHDVLPEWFSLYVSLEAEARLIRSYEPHFVPGILQTDRYAREVMTAGTIGHSHPEEVERHVALRLDRQQLLAKPEAPHLWIIMDETVLRRPVASAEVMAEQMDRLVTAAHAPRLTLQVAEFAEGPHPGTYGPFSLFRFTQPELPDMVYCEFLTGALYLDSPIEVANHLEVLDHMSAQAASTDRTREILRDARDHYRSLVKDEDAFPVEALGAAERCEAGAARHHPG